MQTPTESRELPLLGGLAALIWWTEELVIMAAGPLLSAGLVIAVVALVSDGAILVSLPILLYAWAVSLALGMEAQLTAAFARAARAWRERRFGSLLGYLLLGAVLAYVAWVSAYAFGVQQADHLTITQALLTLGMDDHIWGVQRFALQVGLVCYSGWTRYHPPSKVTRSVEDELAEIERKTKIAAANQRLREQQALGVARMGRSVLAAAKGVQIQDVPGTQVQEDAPEKPPTGPGTPLAFPIHQATDDDEDEPGAYQAEEALLSISQPAASVVVPSGRREVRKTISVEGRKAAAYKLLRAHPELSVAALARELGCRWGVANNLKKAFLRDQESQRRVQ